MHNLAFNKKLVSTAKKLLNTKMLVYLIGLMVIELIDQGIKDI